MSKIKANIQGIILIIFALLFVLAGLLLFVRYSKQNFIYRNKEPMKIGATYMTLNNPFFSIIDNEIRSVVESKGDVLISLDPALDLDKQKAQIQYLIDEKVSLIIVNPVDFYGLTKELEAAKKANIPVVTVDTDVVDESLVSFRLIADNYDVGVTCAKDMMSRKEHADIVLLQHSTAYSAVQRIQGFVDTIKDKPQYKIVTRIECEGQLEKAMPLMDDFLQKDIDFNVVMALNDPSALGALAAMQNRNKLDGILVYGVDGSPEAKTLIANHIMSGTVSQSPKTMGKKTAEAVYKILAGKPYEKTKLMPVTLINEKNIRDYPLEGWQ